MCSVSPGVGVRGPGTAVVDQPAGAAEVMSRPLASTLINGQPRSPDNPPVWSTTQLAAHLQTVTFRHDREIVDPG